MPDNGKLAFLFLLFLVRLHSPGVLFSQTIEENVKPVSGRYVHLHINSLNRYRNGHEINDYTRVLLDIKETDLATPDAPWTLYAYTEELEMLGDYGNKIDVDYISITSQAGNPAASVLTYLPITSLSTGQQPIVTGTGFGQFIILVSYGIGKDIGNRLMGESSDYYFIDLYFHLKTD